MLIDTNDLVSATDFNRNTGRYTALAAEGRRIVIIKDQQLVAALVGIHDLTRLDALDAGANADLGLDAAPTTTTEQLQPEPGTVPVGLTSAGTTVSIDPREHLLVIGQGASDLAGMLLANAGWSLGHDTPAVRFVAGAERPALMVPTHGTAASILAVATDLRSEHHLDRFAEQIDGEIEARTDQLRHHTVNTVAQYRSQHPEAPDVDHLVVIIDDADNLLKSSLSQPISRIIRDGRDLSITVWLFSNLPPSASPALRAVPRRIALKLPTGYQSREVIGSDAAARLKPRQALLSTDTAGLTPFTIPEIDEHKSRPATPAVPPERRWPTVPEPAPIETLIERWFDAGGENNQASAPIGMIDQPRLHRHNVYALDFSRDSGHTAVLTGNHLAAQHLTKTVLISAARLNTPETLRFCYLGDPPPGLGHIQESITVWRWEDLIKPDAIPSIEAITTELDRHEYDGQTLLIADLFSSHDPPTGSALRAVLTALYAQAPRYGLHVLSLHGNRDALQIPHADTLLYLAGTDVGLIAVPRQRQLFRSLPNDAHHALATSSEGNSGVRVTAHHLVLATNAGRLAGDLVH